MHKSNRGADFLTNWGCTQLRKCGFERAAEMPKVLKGLCRLNKIGLPSIRYKRW